MVEAKKLKVLLTGAKGFIGQHTVKALIQKHRVKNYDISEGHDVLDHNHLEDEVAFFKPEAIMHLAAQVSLKPSLENPRHDAETNIIGAINVLEAARKYGCKVVYSSSGAVYGSNDRSHITEDHDKEPMSPYGISKKSAEMYVLLYNDLYGMDNVVFRFSSVYGVGRKKTSINLILDRAMKGEEITVTGDGSQTRDFTHVSDVAEALVMAVEGKFPKGVYNIGTGISTSITQLIQLMEEILQKKVRIKYVTKQEGDPLKNDFNVDKAECYGFKAKVKLKQGIQRLIDDYLADELTHL